MARSPLVAPGADLEAHEVARYSRQLRMPQIGSEGQRRLKAARVLVLGAGGLGSPILLYLAGAGVGTLGVVDDDVVDESNLQRQIIHSSDRVGESKARSVAAAVARLNPLVTVDVHEVRLEAANARTIFADYDLVIDGTDNFATRYLANDTAAEFGMPYIWGSVLRFDGQVSTFWHRQVADDAGDAGTAGAADAAGAAVEARGAGAGLTLRDLFPEQTADDEAESCSVAGVLGPLCGAVGAAMATEAMKLVVGFGEPLFGRVLVIDALEGSYVEVPFATTPDALMPQQTDAHAADAHAAHAHAAQTHGADARTADAHPPHGAGSPEAQQAGARPSLTVKQLAARLEARASGADDFILLDVRDPWEYELARIDGSILLPLPALLSDAAAEALPKTAEIVAYCHLDVRSQYAREVLLQSGWQNIVFVEGGIEAWSRQIDPDVVRY